MASTYHIGCDCGGLGLSIHGTPRASTYCHCASCRAVYGVEVLAATTWDSDAVKRRVADGVDVIAHRQPRRRLWRYHCSACGRLVHGRNRRGDIVIPNERFRVADDGTLAQALQPTMHCFYDERVIDILDDLPKHAGAGENAYSDNSEN